MNWNEVCALPNQKKNGKNACVSSKLSTMAEKPFIAWISGVERLIFCSVLEDRN
ncbi:hypothetical protein [Collimonas arenae]|uniref:hypothetical protein n=1 Tax=Collimonas arenae TaxID=279058 RepID=UPI0012E0AE36|nr:hypothetical protein [Collimonas arenae]